MRSEAKSRRERPVFLSFLSYLSNLHSLRAVPAFSLFSLLPTHSSLLSPLSFLLALLLLTGCSGAQWAPRLPRLPFLQLGETPAETDEVLRLLFPEEGAVTPALRHQVEAWASDRGMQIEMLIAADYSQELRNRLQGDDPPDLFVVSSFAFPDLAANGLLAPAAAEALNAEEYPPQLAAAFTWPADGEPDLRYCLPREVRTLALVYDSDGLAAAEQSPPTDWETLRAVAEAQTDLDRGRFGLIESPDLSRWLPFLFGAGGRPVDENGRVVLQSPAAEAALDIYIQLFRGDFAGHAGESNSAWAGEVLGKGKGGVAIEGNWIAPFFAAEFPDFRYGVAPLPAGPAGLSRSVAFTSCYAVSARSLPQHRTIAFALAAFLSSPQVVRALPNDGGWMPAHTALQDEWQQHFPHLAAFAQAIPQAWVWQLPVGFDLFLRGFNRGMVKLFAAEIEAADLLAEMQLAGEGIVEREERSKE